MYASIELINKYYWSPSRGQALGWVGDIIDCSHQACFPGGNEDVLLDMYSRVLHAMLKKFKIFAVTWRGSGKVFARKLGLS